MRTMSLDFELSQDEDNEITEIKKKIDSSQKVLEKIEIKIDNLKYLVS